MANFGLVILFAAVSLSCTNSAGSDGGIPIPPESAKRQASGELGPGDVISITYPGAPELNLSQKIRADGKVSLPIIGDVQASGRSLASFQSELTRRYEPKLQDSTVLVSVVSAAAAVYVSGEVRNPGKVPLDRPLTALDAVMESGGFSPTSNPRDVSVVRTENGKHQRYNLDLSAALSGTGKAFYLKSYDVVYVGQRKW